MAKRKWQYVMVADKNAPKEIANFKKRYQTGEVVTGESLGFGFNLNLPKKKMP